MDADDADDLAAVNLFEEPPDFYQAEKPATVAHYTLKNGQRLALRLGHLIWNAGHVMAEYLEDHADTLIHGKAVLELGAGAGLPSLICASLGARRVVVTDYPDPDLIENLRYNIAHCPTLPEPCNLVAQGLLWGSPPDAVKAAGLHGPGASGSAAGSTEGSPEGFDVLILADLLFNHSEHAKLLATLQACLKPTADAVALVFFTPYRPWLLEKDRHFLELARTGGFVVSKILERVMDQAMFENDPGDETLRRTVFGYELRWRLTGDQGGAAGR